VVMPGTEKSRMRAMFVYGPPLASPNPSVAPSARSAVTAGMRVLPRVTRCQPGARAAAGHPVRGVRSLDRDRLVLSDPNRRSGLAVRLLLLLLLVQQCPGVLHLVLPVRELVPVLPIQVALVGAADPLQRAEQEVVQLQLRGDRRARRLSHRSPTTRRCRWR